jgi:hypothetical protein
MLGLLTNWCASLPPGKAASPSSRGWGTTTRQDLGASNLGPWRCHRFGGSAVQRAGARTTCYKPRRRPGTRCQAPNGLARTPGKFLLKKHLQSVAP